MESTERQEGTKGAEMVDYRTATPVATEIAGSEPRVEPATPRNEVAQGVDTSASPTPGPIVSQEPAWRAKNAKVTAIETFLAGRPLAEIADVMVTLADEHGVDWRLMPAIALWESGAGVAACGGNAWGVANCEVTYDTFADGAEAVARLLAGPYYAGLELGSKLCVWKEGDASCSSASARDYAARVIWSMAQLEALSAQ